MKTYFCFLTIFLAGLFLAACSPARTGVVGGTLTTNVRPAVSIKANAPLVLADSGRLWPSPKTDGLPGEADASFDYAVYLDPSVPPSSRLAYAAIIRLEDMETWNFTSQSTLPGAFGGRQRTAPIGHGGFMYTLYVPSSGDWASDLLAANGTPPPEAWVAKRWVYDVDKGARAIAEYREPWPADLDVPEAEILLIGDASADFLRAFERRALSVFTVAAELGDFSGVPEAQSSWEKAPSLPDVARLVGDISRMGTQDSGADVDFN